jgi:hypothetical protein
MLKEYGVVVVGLYRGRQAFDSAMPYVYAAPDPDAVIYYVFVRSLAP